MECSKDPNASHGFDRNSSHSEGRYVCECEHYEAAEMTTTPAPTANTEPVAWIYEESGRKPFASMNPPSSFSPDDLSEHEVSVTALYPESALQAERERAQRLALQYDAELRHSEKVRKELAALKEAVMPEEPEQLLELRAAQDYWQVLEHIDTLRAVAMKNAVDAERYRYAQKNLRIGKIMFDSRGDCNCDFDDMDDAAIDRARGQP